MLTTATTLPTVKPVAKDQCRICAARSLTRIGPSPDFAGVDIVGCTTCSAMYTSPMPDQAALAELYKQEYRTIRKEKPGEKYLWRMQQRAHAQWEFITAHQPQAPQRPAAVLDIGCGAGLLLEMFTDSAMTLVGFEPDETMSQFAQEHLGDQAQIYNTVYDRSWLAEQRFDIITASHVLEHIPDPTQFLHGLLSLLTDNGILFIEVPHESIRTVREQVRYRVAGLMHLWFFRCEPVLRLIRQANGRLIALATYGSEIGQFTHVPIHQRRRTERLLYRGRHTAQRFIGIPAPPFESMRNWSDSRLTELQHTMRYGRGIWLRMLITNRN